MDPFSNNKKWVVSWSTFQGMPRENPREEKDVNTIMRPLAVSGGEEKWRPRLKTKKRGET